MGAVKAWLMDIEEDVVDAICENKLITPAVIEAIAKKNFATVEMVKEVYEDVKKENYGDW